MRLTPTRLVALIAVALTAALTATGCAAGDNHVHFTADFTDAAGLYPGNDVDVLGIPVGTVDSISPSGDHVSVAMTIGTEVKVPADAYAAIVSPQLITNRHVELTPAYPGHGPALTTGDHITVDRTRTPVEIDRILESFDRISTALKGNDTTGPLASRVLYPILNGNGDRLRRTLDNLAGALQVTDANRNQIADAVVKLNDITSTIADNDKTVREFSGQLTNLSTLLADQSPGLNAVLDQLNDFVTNTSGALSQRRPQLTDALNRLIAVTALMRHNARNLTELTDVAPLFFQNSYNAIDFGDQALRLHGLLDKSALDGEALSVFCERVLMRANGCRSGKIADMGPDLGMTAALLGLSQRQGIR